MPSLLIIAHGSRRAASNDEVRELARAVAAQPGCTYDRVEAAFLELAEPSIPDGLALLADAGAADIVAFPYFLAAGRHVAEDIPAEIGIFAARYPAVNVRMTAHLGASSALTGTVLAVAACETGGSAARCRTLKDGALVECDCA
jgi:sirohydrochlorin ferrochelatase